MKLLSSVTVPLVLLGSSVAPGSCCPPPDPPGLGSREGGATSRLDVGGGKTDGDSIDPAQIEAIEKRLATNERRRVAFAKGQPFRGIDELRLPRRPEGDDAGADECIEPPPPPTLDVHRSLFVHDVATLGAADFSLRRTLGALADQITAAGVSGVTDQTLFRDLWDTQNDTAGAVTAAGAQCDDDGSTINGFPNSCPRAEGAEASNATQANIASYRPIALVNRLDLAHEGWSNCGEHRIVYGKTGGPGRNFVIFEAVLPNPSPGCKDACRPVAEMWAELSTDPDPSSRASKLEAFYYDGLPGFRPVVHVDHYSPTGGPSGYGSAGGGQIRTNQFAQGPWTLKEFRTLIECGSGTCELQLIPDTVKLNPFAELWDPSLPAAALGGRVDPFRAAIATQVAALGSAADASSLGYELVDDFNGAQSNSQQGSGDTGYCSEFGCASGSDHYLSSALATFNSTVPSTEQLSAAQIVGRANAVSCGGCHQPASFGLTSPGSLGPVSSGLDRWPNSAQGGFVHTHEQATAPLPNPAVFGSQPGFVLSAALLDEFLPTRRDNLLAFLGEDDCPCGLTVLPRLPKDVLIDLRKRFPFPPRGRELPPLKRSLRLHELDRSLERASVTAAQRQGLKPPVRDATSRGPRTVSLPQTRAIDDRKERDRVRAKAIREQIADQPPRRTVTGSFRVH